MTMTRSHFEKKVGQFQRKVCGSECYASNWKTSVKILLRELLGAINGALLPKDCGKENEM